MVDERDGRGPGGDDSDATTGGGASSDRGGRDAGMPGPAPDAVPADAQGRRFADSPGPGDGDRQAPEPGSPNDDATSTVTGGGPSS